MTANNESAYADQITDRIRGMNGQTFLYEDQKIPLTLHVAVVSLKECSRYEEVFSGLHNAIKDSKTY